MGAVCGACCKDSASSPSAARTPLTEEEKAEVRARQLAAAEERQKQFKQGGGGETLKAKAKKLEEAQRSNLEKGGKGMMKASDWD